MGLFDSLIGSVLSEVQKQGGLATALGPMLANDGPLGGLNGLISMFDKAGLGHLVASWIGNGDNLPVSGQQISSALGGETLGKLAQQFGMNPAQVSDHLSEMLPDLVNSLTPHGQAPEGGLGSAADIVGRLGALLQK